VSAPLLEIVGLDVAFGERRVVRDFAVAVAPGERVGLVGESGSGKSLSARALIGLLPKGARAQAASYRFDGAAFDPASPSMLARLRGRGIAMVLQDPKYSLNPTMTAGAQIAEVCGRSRALALLAEVGLGEPERVFDQYPGALSGGMGQRVMIAMMLAAEPKLLIADEPTSALDVTVANGVLALLDRIVVARRMALLFISHDLDLVGQFCDRVLVMYAGRVVERLATRALDNATHPYTRGLLACRPRLDAPLGPLPTLTRDPSWGAA
jgi:peptide/nickel transport system ATP-binding protein